MRRILPREWAFPLLSAVALIVLGTAPYLYGYWSAGADEVFMGFVGRGTPGANSYLAFARQVAEGHTLLTNLYTTKSPEHAYFHLEWWLYGVTCRITGLSLLAMFHVTRVGSVIAFCVAVYYLAATLIDSIAGRRAALMITCLGAGMGWLIYLANWFLGIHLEPSLDMLGVTTFGYLVSKPHFIESGVFAALQYAWFIRGDQSGNSKYFLLAGLAAALNTFVRPYHIAEAFLFLAAYPCLVFWFRGEWSLKAIRGSLLALLLFAPAILLQAYTMFHNPLGLGGFVSWYPLSLLSLVLWQGIPLFAVLLFGLWQGFGHAPAAPRDVALLTAWLCIALLLLFAHPYFPFAQESYFAFVLAPPILFVGQIVPRLRELLPWSGLKRWKRRGIVVVFIAAAAGTNALVYTKFFYGLHHPDEPWQYYLPKSVISAAEWLKAQGAISPVVLASHDTSQFLPRLAHVRVVTGQDALTPDYPRRNNDVFRFFWTPGEDEFKRWICQQWHVKYVIAGPFELAGGFKPEAYPWLKRSFVDGNAAVYEVSRN
ncbi:MAG: hypothetical protein HYV27_13120 [Candidatus Hydrogenedentes bacterium]|nr:hypothetical protein [Candidatus Hydrogenedentota bacterium]